MNTFWYSFSPKIEPPHDHDLSVFDVRLSANFNLQVGFRCYTCGFENISEYFIPSCVLECGRADINKDAEASFYKEVA